MGADIDMIGAGMIYDGKVICELTPLDLALGVFSLGNLALAIYVAAHTPAARVGPDIRATASALDCRPHGEFSPADSFFTSAAHGLEDISYDVTAVYVKVVQALGRASEEVLRIRLEDARGDFPDSLGLFASANVQELASCRRRLGNGLTNGNYISVQPGNRRQRIRQTPFDYFLVRYGSRGFPRIAAYGS
jgi:hypothetical protein